MGKDIPWSFQKMRGGEQLNLKSRPFTNVASLTAAGITPARNPGALLYLSAGGTGSIFVFEKWCLSLFNVKGDRHP